MDKRVFVNLQASRKVSGVLRGYDIFLNLVLDDATEETNQAEKKPIGTIVSWALSQETGLLNQALGDTWKFCRLPGDFGGRSKVIALYKIAIRTVHSTK